MYLSWIILYRVVEAIYEVATGRLAINEWKAAYVCWQYSQTGYTITGRILTLLLSLIADFIGRSAYIKNIVPRKYPVGTMAQITKT